MNKTFTLTATAFTWFLIFVYSFTQRDLNLTIYNIPPLQGLQNQLSYLGYFMRPLSTILFALLIIFIWLAYLSLINQSQKITTKTGLYLLIVIAVLGVVAYPLFSHDIFNYLFNAKMVLVYHVDPHLQTANQFMTDPWTRFMHNVHTAAPYGYGWTALSLLPLLLTIKNFTLSFWAMKVFVIGFFFLQAYLIYKISQLLFPKRALPNTVIFAFNPLFILETFFIGHNDSVMLALALLAIYLLLKFDQKKSYIKLLLVALFYGLSIYTKYATIVLAPFMVFRKKIDLFTWGGFALLAILLTRPGQLHSWYLQWGLTLLILSKYRWSRPFVLVISFAGMLRYLPFIYYGNWDPPVPMLRWLLLLAPLSLLCIKKIRTWLSNL